MRIRWFTVLSLAATCSCAPDLPDLEWYGDYVALATDAPVRPCGATITRMDRFVERTHEFFGRTPVDDPIAVYYLPEAWERGYPCPEPDGRSIITGCAHPWDRTAFFESFSVLEHELVHVAMADMAGYHDPLFDEGTAVALGSRSPLSAPPDDRVEAMLGRAAQAVDYTAAGFFVRSLIDRHGPETFLDFYADGESGISPADTRARFERHFGETIDEAAAHYRARDHQCFFELGVCDDEALIPWRGDEWHYARAPTCDDEDVWGFNAIEGYEDRRELYFGTITVGLEIPADGHYEATSSVGGTLRRCGPTCEDHEVIELGTYDWQRPYLRAGYYTLTLGVMFGYQDIGVTLRRSGTLTESET